MRAGLRTCCEGRSGATEGRIRNTGKPLDDRPCLSMTYSLHGIISRWSGEVEGTDGIAEWFANVTDDEQVSVGRIVDLLAEYGPSLPFPYSSGVEMSRHRHMRELRIQHQGRPYRVLYAFDPRRAAILLLGGDKTGDNRWYEAHVPKADTLYDEHLRQLEQEG